MKKLKFAINHKMIIEDLKDHDVFLNHPDMKDIDIKKVTDIDGNELKFATPDFVQIPELSCDKDTIIYIYY